MPFCADRLRSLNGNAECHTSLIRLERLFSLPFFGIPPTPETRLLGCVDPCSEVTGVSGSECPFSLRGAVLLPNIPEMNRRERRKRPCLEEWWEKREAATSSESDSEPESERRLVSECVNSLTMRLKSETPLQERGQED
jgi:hypothetical protein